MYLFQHSANQKMPPFSAQWCHALRGSSRIYTFVFLPFTIDPLQYTYRPSLRCCTPPTQSYHYSWKGCYVRLLFIDFSSAFNSAVPTRLAGKLIKQGLNIPLCVWILDFPRGQ
jgi:hypothetical protein